MLRLEKPVDSRRLKRFAPSRGILALMKKLRFSLALLLLVGAGAALWFIQYRPQFPSFSLASISTPAAPDWHDTVANVDKTVAESIRRFSSGEVKLEDLIALPSIEQISEATLSAKVSTSPEELWQSFRQRGSQAVLEDLGGQIEYSINGVSATAIGEARYQYCLGVVEAYQQQP